MKTDESDLTVCHPVPIHPANQTGVKEVQSATPELANQKWTLYLVFSNVSIILGSSLMYGYNSAIINAPYAVMNEYLNDTFVRQGNFLSTDELSVQWSVAVTLFLIGGAIGSIWLPAALIRTLGKRNALLVNSGIGAIGAILLFISPWTGSCVPFMLGRAITGVQSGIAMIAAPDLIAEHAPARLRGGCGSLFTIGAPIGVCLANLLGLNFILGQTNIWQYLFLILLALFIIHAVSLLFVVESPISLVDHGKGEEAIKALIKLRNTTGGEVQFELMEIKRFLDGEKQNEAISFFDVFKHRQLWWPMILVVQLGIVAEGAGIAAACFYATKVLEDGGMDSNMSSVANFCMSLGTIFGVIVDVVTVDRFGRRLLMIVPLCFICLANVMLIIALKFKIFQLGIAGFVLFMFSNGCGPGILPLYVTGEMFPQAAKPHAYAVGMFTQWTVAILLSFVFPVMQLDIGEFSFLPFVGVSFLESVFFIFFLPETSERLVDYDPDRFAPGRSLLQLRRPSKRSKQNNAESRTTTL